MKRVYTFNHLLLAAIFASLFSGFLLLAQRQVFRVAPALAQNATLPGLTLYAAPRRDTMKDESFIFYDAKTGDLWVYRNEKLKKHYRVTTMGQDLEKVKD